MSAREVMDEIILNVKKSNLNFNINLTPFSAYITIRNSFTKSFSPSASTLPQPVKNASDDLLNQQKDQHVKEIDELNAANKASRDTIKILEDKISKIEASALRAFDERRQETATLKTTLKNQANENTNLKKDVTLANKNAKEKDKEIYRVEQKNENLSDNIKQFKLEISNLKAESKKLQKKKSLKLIKSTSVKTNTMPVSICSSTCYPSTSDTSLSSSSTSSLLNPPVAKNNNSSPPTSSPCSPIALSLPKNNLCTTPSPPPHGPCCCPP